MIKIINLETAEELVIKPTTFPDKTSQVWKLPKTIFQKLNFSKNYDFYIEWEFENEGEFLQLIQLQTLLKYSEFGEFNLWLHMPFLPYGRQDKSISNEQTFALYSFAFIFEQLNLFERITTLDAHSSQLKIFENIIPNEYIKNAMDITNPDLICFPDKGASKRGYNILNKPFFSLEKERNQLTGEITGLKLENDLYNLKNKIVLILDDICDGGRTFIEAAKLLYNEGVKEVHLYVTHGIFSKGIQVLHDAGIKRIFTYKGEQ